MKRILITSAGKILSLGLFTLAALVAATSPAPAASCTPPPTGLVGWWKGDGKTLDTFAGNNGVNQNITYTNGVVGQAFACDPENYPYGTYTGIQIADQPAYALTNSLTIEAWVRPRGDGYVIFFRGDHRPGLDPYALSMQGNNQVAFQMSDAAGNSAQISTALPYFQWTHVAATLDGGSGSMSLYTNGALAAQQVTTLRPFGALLPDQSPGVGIGNVNDGGNNFPFIGDIDELGLYNRALTPAEILAIYNAGSAGKCISVPSAPGVPVIAGFTPAVGASGAVVTLAGTNFSATAASNIVYFGAVRAAVLSASPSSLTVAVPSGATFGPITVTAGGLTAYSSQLFEPTFTGTGSNITSSSFAPSFNLSGSSGPQSMVIADLDGDGKPDLAFVNGYNNAISIYRNISTNGALLGPASFSPRLDLNPATNGVIGSSYRLRAVDLDGDGKLDLIVCDVNSDHISLFHNLATPGSLTTNSFEAPFTLAASYDTRFATAADLDGDGRVDIVALNYGAKTISIYKNLGPPGILNTSSFAPPVILPAPGGPYEAVLADLDGDGKPDLAVANSDNNTISIYQNQVVAGVLNSNSFAPRVAFPGGASPETIAAVDLDGDGRPDLVTGSVQSDNVNVYRNLSSGGLLTTNSFAAQVDFGTPGWMHTVSVADFNGDGKPDLGVCGELNSYMAVFQNISAPGSFTASSFAPRVDFGTGWNAWGIAAGDLNGDGRPDVVFGNYYDNTVQIYQNVIPFGGLPVITLQPTNQNVAVGGTAAFAVAAQGALPLSFQWSFNGTNLSGATNGSLILNSVRLDQAGSYAVLVTNAHGAAVSSNAVLSVNVTQIPPAIVAQTPNQVVLLGHTATFSVAAGGSDPLSYFWSRNGALIPGATNASYSLVNAQLADSGSRFSCLVTNAYGSASSTNVTLKVIDTIANDLCSGAIVISGGSYTNLQSTLKASSIGDPVPDCVDGFGHGVWYQFTAPVSGLLIVDTFGSDFDTGLAVYTGSCDALNEVACNDDTGGVTSQVTLPTTAGTTYSILAGGYGSDAGNLVLHLNHLTPPAFAAPPANQSVRLGSNATFSATLTGALPMSFQWLFNNAPLTDGGRISGATTTTLIISNLTTADAGGYALVASNFLGTANSAPAVLTVLVPPAITLNPIGRSVPPGLPTTFTAAATGIPTPSYQWQLNGTNLPGATGASYTNAAIAPNDLGFYAFVASNSVGVSTSQVAQLTFGPVAAWGRNLNNECLPPPGLSNVVSVAGTYQAGFALRMDGTIMAWGSTTAANIPASASNVVAIAASGNMQNYALRADGTVVSWNGNLTVPALSNVVAVAAGNIPTQFGIALRAEGSLVGWGQIPYSTIPTGLNHVTAIAAGYSHSLALKDDGTVVSWGSGPGTNVPIGLANVTAIAAGYTHSLALKSNGTVVAWGSDTGTNLPTGLTNIVAVSTESYPASQNLSLALRANGTVVAWGTSSYGEAITPKALSNLLCVAVAAAPYHSLALVNDGSPQIIQPPIGLTAYTGRDVTLRGAAAGAAPLSYQWRLNGTNVPGATNPTLFLSNLQLANAGNYQLFVSNALATALSLPAPVNVISNNALIFLSQTTNGVTNYQGSRIVTDGFTVLGNGPLRYQWFFSPTNKNYSVVPGATNDTLVLDPALVVQSGNYYVSVSNLVSGITSAPVNIKILFARAWGYNTFSTNPPVNVTNAIAVATGGANGNIYSHYLALGADGKVTAWGISPASLAFPPFATAVSPTNVAALSNSFVTAIAAGYQHSLALKSDGTVYAWGEGSYGRTNPPSGLNSVVAIACGGYHDLALRSDGTVVGWGAGDGTLGRTYDYGQATNNPNATNVVGIAAGNLHSFALRADGTVVGWGYAGDGAIFIPASASNVVQIAAGNGFAAALRANGTVVQWGTGMTSYPVPAIVSNVVSISAAASHCTALKNDGTVVSWGYEYVGPASNNIPPDLANVAAIASGGDHDIGLFGTRAPAFTVQPWNRTISISTTSVWFAAKCVGVQPVSYQWRLNGTNLPGATTDTFAINSYPGAHGGFLPLPSGVYQLVASNTYGVAISKPAKLSVVIPLAEALDTMTTNGQQQTVSLYNWLTSGNAQWFGQTNITHDGVDAARSGGIGGSQETILQTTLATNLPGTVTFWWKVSSEQFFDTLEFRINGNLQAVLSGEVDWQSASFPVAAGTNFLMWRYSKDPTFDVGLDAAFVDQFAFVSGPLILSQPASVTANSGDTVSLSVAAVGVPQVSYQWTQNGAAVGGNSPVLTLSSVSRAQDGVYSVIVTNSGGMAVSSNALVVVRVPQLLGTPVLQPDGSLQLTSADLNGGWIAPEALANFEAQASTNLVDWATLPGALSVKNGRLQLNDAARTNFTARYYRIVEH